MFGEIGIDGSLAVDDRAEDAAADALARVAPELPRLIGNPDWVWSSAWIWLRRTRAPRHVRRIDIETDDVGELVAKAESRGT